MNNSHTSHQDKLHMALAHNIKLLRCARGWTQETLATLAGIHPNYIGRVERAETNIGLTNLSKIADAFNIPAYELLQNTTNPPLHTWRAKDITTHYWVGHA